MLDILLVEDDQDLAELITEYLELVDMHCENAPTGALGLQLARDAAPGTYDCIVLDLNLPVLDGLTLCRSLRADGIATPLIMLTARGSLEDKLEGFACGADDYLGKPFEMRELIARIRALTQRNRHGVIFRCGDLIVDAQKRIVERGCRSIRVSHIGWIILRALIANSPNPVHKTTLIRKIWGDQPPETDSLKVHIYNLRKALDPPGRKPLLKTVPGYGYALYDDEN